jgi:predicted amino acid-binding ACT domain protein
VPVRCPDFDLVWPALAAEQDGIVARQQLLACGLSPGAARREIVARRWRRLYPGVYATFSGPVPDRAQIWAALLRAGPGAVAGHRTALWLAGVIDDRPGVIGRVGTILGDAGVNIADMDVGRSAQASSALMVIATTQPAPTEVVEALRACDGVTEVAVAAGS